MSIYILILGIMSLVVCGLPLTYIAYKQENSVNSTIQISSNVFWAMTLFTGYATLTLPLKILTKCNIPLKYTSIPVAILFLLMFMWFIIKRPKIPAIPIPLVIGLVTVILISGVSYFVIGAKWYRGYDWYDMSFYGPQSQFLIDYPINTPADSIKNAPWLSLITHNNYYNTHRIARGVLQAFLTVVGFLPDANYTLGFISLLGPILTFLSIVCVLSKVKINEKLKIIIAVWAATIPGYTLLTLECFIGSSLMVGFIILWGSLVYDLADNFNIAKLILVSLIFAAASTTYTEMTYVLIGLSFVVLLFALMKLKITFKKFLLSISSIPLGLICNIQYFNVYQYELSLQRVNSTAELDAIYSQYAYKPAGLAVLFFGKDSNTLTNSLLSELVGFCSVCLLFIAVIGIVLLLLKEDIPHLISLVSIIVLPVLFISSDKLASLYKFYRMLSQAAPIFAVGVVYFFYILCDKVNRPDYLPMAYKTVYQLIIKRFLVVCVSLIIVFSSFMTAVNTTGTVAMGYLKYKYTQEQYDFLDELSSMKGQNIYLISSANYMDTWSVYYGKNNKIWLSRYPWILPWVFPKTLSYYNYSTIPDDCQIMVTPGVYNPVQDSLINTIGAYLTNEKFEQLDYPPYSSSDNKFYMDVFSKKSMEVTMSFVSKNVPEGAMLEIGDNLYPITSNEPVHAVVTICKGKQTIPITIYSQNGDTIILDSWKINKEVE